MSGEALGWRSEGEVVAIMLALAAGDMTEAELAKWIRSTAVSIR